MHTRGGGGLGLTLSKFYLSKGWLNSHPNQGVTNVESDVSKVSWANPFCTTTRYDGWILDEVRIIKLDKKNGFVRDKMMNLG